MQAVDTLIKALSDYVNDDIAAADNKDVTQADIDNCCDTLIKALSDHVNDDIADADNDDITEADIDTVFNILIWRHQ